MEEFKNYTFKIMKNKITKLKLALTSIVGATVVLTGCATQDTNPTPTQVWSGNGKQYPVISKEGKKYLSIPPEDFLLQKEVIAPPAPTTEGTCIQVDIENQRAWLYKNGELTLTTVICPGKPGHETPRGEFHVLEKQVEHESTLYHVAMPYFMRLSTPEADVGLHAGIIATQPASHGCIRLPRHSAEEFYQNTPVGAKVFVN